MAEPTTATAPQVPDYYDGPEEPAPAPAEPTPEPAAKPAAPKHSEFMVRMARDLGLTDAQIQGRTPDELERTVDILHQRDMHYQRTLTNALDRRPAPAPTREPEPVDEDAELLKELGIEDASLYDPAILKAMKGQQKKSKLLEAELAELKAKQLARESQAMQDQLLALYREHPEIYGDGDETDDETPEGMKRLALYAALEKLVLQKKHTTLKKDFAALHVKLFGKAAEPVAKPAAGSLSASYDLPAETQTVSGSDGARSSRPRDPETGKFLSDAEIEARDKIRWMEGGLHRPTARTGSEEPTGRLAAERAVREKMRERGMPLNGSLSSEPFVP